MEPALEEWVENVRMLTESAGAVVPADGTLARVRAARFTEPGFSREVWATIVEMGWLGICLGEEAGGYGLGLREAVALTGLLGKGLVPEPVIPATLALRLLEQAGADAIPGEVLAGESVLLAAWQATPDGLDPRAGVEVAGGRLTGTKIAVAGGAGADAFAVTTPVGVAVVPCDAEGLSVTPLLMHDGTFHARLDFAAVPCAVLACPDMEASLYEAVLLHAGYLLGLSEQAFEITLDYLRIRKQFEVPIGSFQALQHRATEIKVQLELARAAIGAAAASLDLGQHPARARMAVLRARTRAGGLARLVAREAIQMHGAIGYTDESDIGLYAKKALVEAGLFAPEFRLKERFMALRDAAAASATAPETAPATAPETAGAE
ncbi:MAG: acyl-CoA dehydrogenase family protein [Rhodospirillaceae bacterium]|nr:acyl-CoA dehydrogenase family protein [Rhodospirillaceae bacterium]